MLQHFFHSPDSHLPLVSGSYHFGLVFLSILVAIALSLLALRMAEVAQRTRSAFYTRLTIATGAFALGSGIWAMHFIGMFAFQLPAPVRYAFTPTVLSMLPAAAAAWITLTMLTQKSISRSQLLAGGLIMGAGIGTMHYGGMLAIETPLEMSHNLNMFLLSIFVAVTLAMLAIWIRFGLQYTQLSNRSSFWLGGIVMGCAIAGMHYTAMQAVQFHGFPQATQHTLEISTISMALVISLIALTIAMAVAAVNGLIYSRELNRTINESKQRVSAILDTAVDSILTINPVGTVQEFSRSAERMFGYHRNEVIGQNVKMLMPEPYYSEHDGYLLRYMNTKIPRIIGVGREVIGRRKDGSTFPMRLSVGQVNLPNNELLFVGVITDITDRKQLENSLREEAEKAQQAAVAKSNFLANMSHEIRTPMNAIMGFTELLLAGELNPTQRSHLSTIRQSSRSLLGLLNDILDTSKLDSGRFDLDAEDFSLKVLASQVESTLSLGAQKKKLDLNIHYSANMPEYFVGDSLRILQVLTNLVGNAIKFTERGSVDISFSYEQEQVHIQVSDTGIGMTPKQLASVFEAFTQADASISRRFGGTGLGTTISRQLVEAMKGHIEAESELGIGTTFHVYLPLAIGNKPVEVVTLKEQELPPLNILIADDIEQNRELLTITLEGRGHQVTAAKDGQEAFDFAMANSFDLVLMDVHMPLVDGLKATRMIREQEQKDGRAHLPIVALTASVLASDRKIALQAGMDGFAVKPLDVPQLFAEVARVLSGQAATEPQAHTQSAAVQAIDWERGSQLWGSRDVLAQKIAAFLEGLAATYPLSENLPEEGDSIRFSLHGIKGAAGNLGLMELAQMAGELEELARTERWPQLLDQLPTLHGHIEQLAANPQVSAAHSNSIAAPAEAEPSAPVDSAALKANLEQVKEQLSHSELNDDSLQALYALLNASQQTELQNLLDSFEFDQACELLEQWLTTTENAE